MTEGTVLPYLLHQVKAEITRRKRRGRDHVHRSQLVKEKYRCLHPALYTLSVSTGRLLRNITSQVIFSTGVFP